MKNTKIIIKTKSKSYPVYFGNQTIASVGALIKKNLPNVKKICIISDKNLPFDLLKKLNKSIKKYNPKIYRLAASEKIKSLKIAEKIINDLLTVSLSVSLLYIFPSVRLKSKFLKTVSQVLCLLLQNHLHGFL